MKKYDIYIAGGEKNNSVYSSCISNACKSFIRTLEKPARYTLQSKEYASIRFTDNYTISSDYVIMQS